MDRDDLAAVRRDAASAGIFLDFDGTLSDIVPVPDRARPVPGVTDVLAELARRYAVLAVVSGRSAAQLLEWLGPAVEIWGLHGAERTRDARVVLADEARPFVELMSRVREEAERAVASLGLPGVVVEDKRVMVGLHYRNAPEPELAASRLEELARRLGERFGVPVVAGRKVFELKPPVEFSKAAVVRNRARTARLEAAVFIGDDVVDLPAFDALDELRDDGLLTVRVGVRSAESPAALLERADVVVDGPTGAVDLLRRLVPPTT